jgi:hypothetical protein
LTAAPCGGRHGGRKGILVQLGLTPEGNSRDLKKSRDRRLFFQSEYRKRKKSRYRKKTLDITENRN